MKRLLTIVLALVIAGVSSSAMAAVSGSPHDYTGISTYTLCNPCHVPHAAISDKRLWPTAGTNTSWVEGAGWAGSNIGRLCGTCHYAGGLFTASNAGGNAPHVVTNSVYDPASHGKSLTELKGPIKDTPADTGRPYMTTWGAGMTANNIQCSTCHDPHNNTDVKPFLRAVGTQNSISDVCSGCHDRYNATGYGITNTMPRGANDAGDASMHPVDITYEDQAGNENTSNTVLRTLATLPVALNTPLLDTENWRLGGKFEIGGNLGCNTCHAVHGTATAAGVHAPATNIYLLAVDNNGAFGSAPLCESCHGGSPTVPFASQALADATAATGSALHYVANHQAPTAGVYDDHPLDMTPDGVPALVNWAANTTRWERSTGAGDPAAAAGVWPFGSNGASVYTENALLMGNIVCISCHSAHNGISNSSLRRKGGISVSALGNSTNNPTTGQMTGADNTNIRTAWCYNCHLVTDMVPAFHHSTNDTAGTPANYTAGDIPGTSGAQCDSCHLMGPALTAHNGFFNLNLAGVTNGSSALCAQCHDLDNNLYNGNDPINGLGVNAPNGHLMDGLGGIQSHYLGTFKDGSSTGTDWDINVKRTRWRNVTYKGVATDIYSKYGTTAAGGGTDTHHISAPAVWGATQTIVCESCHSVLFNAGWDGVGTWDASFSSWNVEGGWRTNLLLQLYEDRAPGTGNQSATPTYWGAGAGGPSDVDGADTGSGFCIQCHRQDNVRPNDLITGSIEFTDAELGATKVPKRMHPMTGWSITRAQDSGRVKTKLVTGLADGTYADAATRPDGGAGYLASYPDADAQDCDSCHRPHNAYGVIPGKPKTGTGAVDSTPAILEVGDNTTNVDLVCVSCHNR